MTLLETLITLAITAGIILTVFSLQFVVVSQYQRDIDRAMIFVDIENRIAEIRTQFYTIGLVDSTLASSTNVSNPHMRRIEASFSVSSTTYQILLEKPL